MLGALVTDDDSLLTDDDRSSSSADDAAPTSAAESLRLIKAQTAAVERSLRPDPRLIYWPWGVAWLIGFGLLFLRHGPHEQIRWDMPGWLPLATLYTLMVVAFMVSGFAGARAARQVSGDSSTQGLMYGLSWFVGFTGVAVIANHFGVLLPEPEKGLLWAALSVGLVGVLYMAGGGMWKSRDLFILGCWLNVSNIAGVLAGTGWHSLVISLAGGGGLLVAGLIEWLGTRRRR
jgi:hypothetical protein